MRRSILPILFLAVISFGLNAQEPIYLFPSYTDATFKIKPNIVTRGKINIDAKYQKVYYMQDTDVMEMTNCSMIDTLYVGGRKFVWNQNCLCEYMKTDFGVLYVNWKLRDTPAGKVGAMGTVTQQKVEVMYVPGLNSEHSFDSAGKYEDSTDVWTVKSENTYFWVYKGIEYRIRRPSDLYRYFPGKADAIKDFMRSSNITMKSAGEAEMIFRFIYEN